MAIFLAFQSQAWHTDDATGHAISGAEQPHPAPGDGGAAPTAVGRPASSPPGQPDRPRTRGARPCCCSTPPRSAVDLTGWTIADRTKQTCAVPGRAARRRRATLRVTLTDGVTLGNNGGSITLLDRGG